MASDDLLAEYGYLNPGLLDQKLAFEWIKENIGAFGGDPTRVSAVGQSAGAISIATHMLANKGNQSLFHRAVIMG